jgi:hypothetical protein
MIDWHGRENIRPTRKENTTLPSTPTENFHSAQEPSVNSQMLCSSMMLDIREKGVITARLSKLSTKKAWFVSANNLTASKTFVYNVLAMYIETFRHWVCWVRLYVTFDPVTRTSTSLLLNLLPPERIFIQSRLEDKELHPFTSHPLFVPVLVMELLYQETSDGLAQAHSNSINMYIVAGLHDNQVYNCLKEEDLDIEKASEDSLRHEQQMLILFEKIENNIKIGTKLMVWFSTFDTASMSAFQRKRFESADAILRDRLKYFLDGFDFQLIRLKRAHGHAQLNRLGVIIH